MFDRIRSRPYRASSRNRVVLPTNALIGREVGKHGMIEAWVLLRRFVTLGIDERYIFRRRRSAAGVRQSLNVPEDRDFSGKRVAGCRRRRSSRDYETVRRKAWPLAGLKHSIGEGIGFGHLKIGRNVGGLNVLEPWISRGEDCNPHSSGDI